MQITLDVPDNVPPALLQQYIDEFQNKLKQMFVSTQSSVQPINHRHRVLMEIIQRSAKLPRLDTRSADEILGYGANEMGLWGEAHAGR